MEGLPAIQPHLDTIPAFTEDDVPAFFATRPFKAIRISFESKPAVTNVLFLTSTEASALMHETPISSTPDKQVCYVELSGDFLFSGGPSPGGPSPNEEVVRFHTMHVVFDAETGNMLVQATGEM